MIINLLTSSRFCYRIRKPRIMTQNQLDLIEYRKNLTIARNKVHHEAKDYQNLIEDQYLHEHKENVKKKHFNNQCEFRKIISIASYNLFQNLKKWSKEDELYSAKLNKFLHNEDVKKMNR
jgi:hypothetical protein